MDDTGLSAEELALAYGDHGPAEEDYAVPAPVLTAEDTDRADWHLRRVILIEADAEKEDRMYQRAMNDLVVRRRAAADRYGGRRQWHLDALEQWRRAYRPGDATVRLPSGEYKSTFGGVKLPTPTPNNLEALRAELDDAELDESVAWEVPDPKPKWREAEVKKHLEAVPTGSKEPGTVIRYRWKNTGRLSVALVGTVQKRRRWVQR